MKALIMQYMAKVRVLDYVKPTKAKGDVKRIYKTANAEIGLSADPVLLHSDDKQLLEYFYTLGRETLLVGGSLSRKAKDAIATVVSHQNTCQYCVDAHSVSIAAEKDDDLTRALRDNKLEQIEYHELYELIELFAMKSTNANSIFFDPEDIAEGMATYFYFHYTNRMVNQFVSDSHIPDNMFRAISFKIAAYLMRKYTSKVIEKGEYEDDIRAWNEGAFDWSKEISVVNNRLHAMMNYLDFGTRRIMKDESLKVINDFLNKWNNTPMPFGDWWIKELTLKLDKDQCELVTYCLKFMVANHTITQDDLSHMKKKIGNQSLLILSSWSSFQVASRLTTIKWQQFNNTYNEVL